MASVPAEPSPPLAAAKPALSRRPPLAREANWTVGLAVAVLLIVSLGGYLYHRGQLADIAAEHLRLVVTGPDTLQAQAAAEYNVSTATVTGAAVPAQVEFSLDAPDGQRLSWGHKEKCDGQGRLQVTIPATLSVPDRARLEVLAVYRDKLERVSTRLAVEPVRYVTRLTLDRPLYQPGDTIYYRSLTLSRFGLAADRQMPIHFELLDPGGDTLPDSQAEGLTDCGVGNGAFSLGAEMPGGRYMLVAKSLDHCFPEERCSFFVRRYQAPRLKKQLQFLVPQKGNVPKPTDAAPGGQEKSTKQGGVVLQGPASREGYAPGDKVAARFAAERADGGPAAGMHLRILATVDGQRILEKTAQTDDAGTAQIEFALPEKIDRGDGQLLVVADDGGAPETLAKTIPIHLGKVEVTFYPEGGELVADLENRVYFAARSPLGAPLGIRGAVIDGHGSEVALAETTRDGLGTFSFTPLASAPYALKISSPPGTEDQPKLPKVSTEQKVVLTTGTGVFEAAAPLEFNIRAAKPDLPLVVAASCRGVPVGQQTLITTLKQDGANPVAIPLSDQVGGVLRLTVYDYSTTPPKPVAERLVYRRMSRRLQVRADAQDRTYSPRDKVEVLVKVTDEKGQPVPAALGAAVVDDALPVSAGGRPAAMSSGFFLANEVERPEDLENADFYLSDSTEARIALDLLLGTQGWRRFVAKTLQELKREGRQSDAISRLVALDAEPRPPVMFDNLREIRDKFKESLATYRADRTKVLNTLTTVSFFGGLGLMLLVAMLGLLRIVSGIHLGLSAVSTAICCLVVGTILMDPDRLKSGYEGAVAFVPFHATTQGPAETSARPRPSARDGEEAKRPTEKESSAKASADNSRKEAQSAAGAAAADVNSAAGPPPPESFEMLEAAGAAAPQQAEETAAERAAAAAQHQQHEASSSKRSAGKPHASHASDSKAVEHAAGKSTGESAKTAELGRFVVRQYAHQHAAGSSPSRSDFAETLFWHPLLLADATGRASLKFELPDSAAAFRVRVDAHADGRIGSGGCKIVSRLPLSLTVKLPLEVTAGDRVELPVTVANDAETRLPVELRLRHGHLVQLDGPPRRNLDLSPAERACEYFALNVVGEQGDCELTVHGTAGRLTDAVRHVLRVVPSDFAEYVCYCGHLDRPQEIVADLPEFWLPGSLVVLLRTFSATPADWQHDLPSSAEKTLAPAIYSTIRRRNVAEGKLIVQRDGQSIGEYPFGPGRHETITIDSLEVKLQPGENKLTVLLTGDDRLAYEMDVNYCTRKPSSDPHCPLRLSTQLAEPQVKLGETIALVAELSSTADQAQPPAVAILGIPAGLQPRLDQLEQLRRAGVIDRYEIGPREVLCFWRSLAPANTVEIKLDLLATVPGKFTSPASRIYLEHAPGQKQWADPAEVEITRE